MDAMSAPDRSEPGGGGTRPVHQRQGWDEPVDNPGEGS